MATVHIPSLLRKYTGGKDRLAASGHTLGQIIADLERQFPGLARQLLEDGELKPSLAASVDGELTSGAMFEPVGESSEIYFLPALGGGCR